MPDSSKYNQHHMTDKKTSVKELWSGFTIAFITGGTAYGISVLLKTPIADPLIIALILGIMTRSFTDKYKSFTPGFTAAAVVLLPVGIIFYGASNLNFAKLIELDQSMIVLLMIIMIVYFATVLLLGKLLGQRKQITYLTASGSAVCGASAIAVTSPAVEAEPDDVSISLLSVTIAALFGFAIILPLFSALFNMNCERYCTLSGSVLQFTGLVKVATSFTPFLTRELPASDMLSIALSIKAVRYLGLLVVVPLFASMIKKRLHVPWFLWAFLGAGLLGTWMYVNKAAYFKTTLSPYLNIIHVTSWSVALAAIGLNADIKGLLSNNGAKALMMAFSGFLAATATFFIGSYIMHSF